jgi:tetraacyldisaccharide 4'-kinase
MGGTGKTPHVEYLVRLLKETHRVAVLSRGYGRRTKGFLIAEARHTFRDIGDEPMLYRNKFTDIIVAVDRNRRHGISQLMRLHPAPDVILLDDAFQHRYVKPGLSILLTDYYNLYSKDHLIPAGRLRESRSGSKRADLIVVTKTDSSFSPILEKELLKELNPAAEQKVCYSFIRYENPVSLTGEMHDLPDQPNGSVLMVTGIANPYPLKTFLSSHFVECESLIYRDHHVFTSEDVTQIRSTFQNIPGSNKIIITTEKDAMRLREKHILDLLTDLPFYYLPVRIEFHTESQRTFHSYILNYVGKGK